MKKHRVCVLLLVLLDNCVEVMDTNVTVSNVSERTDLLLDNVTVVFPHMQVLQYN